MFSNTGLNAQAWTAICLETMKVVISITARKQPIVTLRDGAWAHFGDYFESMLSGIVRELAKFDGGEECRA